MNIVGAIKMKFVAPFNYGGKLLIKKILRSIKTFAEGVFLLRNMIQNITQQKVSDALKLIKRFVELLQKIDDNCHFFELKQADILKTTYRNQ